MSFNIPDAPSPSTVAVGASPFVYKNSSPRTVYAVVSNGLTVTTAVSADGVNYDTVSFLAGSMIPLRGGYSIKITYVTAPTLRVI